MAILNRTEDFSEQRKVLEQQFGLVGTGATGLIGMVPWPSVLEVAQMAAYGLSGAPTAQLVVSRFIVGTGVTTIPIGAANVLPSFGTSGVLVAGASLPASGSTLLNLMANDIITVLSGGTNAAVTGLSVNVVLRPIQDIKRHFNLI